MKKEQKKRESIDKKFFSGLVTVLSVALYFISEGFIRLSNKAQKNSSGNTAERPKTRRSKAAAKRRRNRPNPVTAAKQRNRQEQSAAAAVAPAAQKPKKQAAIAPAAPKAEKQAAIAPAAPMAGKHATTAPAAPKVEKQAATAPAAPKVEKQAANAPAAPKTEKQAANAPAVQKAEKQGIATAPATAKKTEKGEKAVEAAKAFPTGLKPVTTPATKEPQKPVQPAVSAAAAQKPKMDHSAMQAAAVAEDSEKQAEKNPRRIILVILLCLLAIAICVLLGIGLVRLTASMRANRIYNDLASSVQQSKDAAAQPTTAPLVSEPVDESSGDAAEPTQPVAETIPPETEPQMLPQYAPLYEKNSDLFGWVKIEDTKIDYPVMYAPNDLERYLYHDFERNSYSGGTPYMDVRCTPDSENYLIYGHNMKNGTMFKHLLNYQSEKFWKEHPTVKFDTLYKEGEYEVVAAFYDRVYYSYEDVFKFYNVIELEDEDSYDDAIANLRKKSIYDTGVVPAYGTQLVTLITCAYHVDNGKFVVVLAEKAAG